MNTLPEITIIRDTREKDHKGWEFISEDKKPGQVRIAGTIEECLDAGDYSIKGLEKTLRIERKFGFSELFQNYSPSSNKERFEREMEKLREIKHKYLLIESTLNSDMLSLTVPQFKYHVPGKRLVEWLDILEQEYNISVKFVGDCGKAYAKTIFRNIARKYL
jgi:hypothetical protein